MENQKVLNSVWDYFLVKKNSPGMITLEDGGECLLRTPEGNLCALGCLPLYMKDKEERDEILEDFEGEPTMGVQRVVSRLKIDFDLGLSLQQTHDLAAKFAKGDLKEFRLELQERLTLIAEEHELTTPKGS